jgi:GntR family transcriptional regulator
MDRKRKFVLQLDFWSGLPVYLQIVRQIERQAVGPRSGRLKPGYQLPTVRGLASELGVNFNTVARAYRLLNVAGVVSTQRGRGTYVIGKASANAVPRKGRPGPRSKREALKALAREYIAQAKRYNFAEAEIRRMVNVGLKAWKDQE